MNSSYPFDNKIVSMPESLYNSFDKKKLSVGDKVYLLEDGKDGSIMFFEYNVTALLEMSKVEIERQVDLNSKYKTRIFSGRLSTDPIKVLETAILNYKILKDVSIPKKMNKLFGFYKAYKGPLDLDKITVDDGTGIEKI